MKTLRQDPPYTYTLQQKAHNVYCIKDKFFLIRIYSFKLASLVSEEWPVLHPTSPEWVGGRQREVFPPSAGRKEQPGMTPAPTGGITERNSAGRQIIFID